MNKIINLENDLLKNTNHKVGLIKSNTIALNYVDGNEKLFSNIYYSLTALLNKKHIPESFYNSIIEALKLEKDDFNKYDAIIVFADLDFIDINNLTKLEQQIVLHELGHLLNDHYKYNEEVSYQEAIKLEIQADSYVEQVKEYIELLDQLKLYTKNEEVIDGINKRIEALKNK